MLRYFQYVEKEFSKNGAEESKISLPVRSTSYSAGYDFFSPIDVDILPDEMLLIWTDVKAKFPYDEVLKIYCRSSLAVIKKLVLANSVGIIDSDYFGNPKNDGNIGIPLLNLSRFPQSIKKGDKIAQGIFEKFLIVDNDNANEERISGFGSTGL